MVLQNDEAEFDRYSLIINNAQLVNVLTGECYPVDVGLLGDRIHFVGPPGSISSNSAETILANGRYLVPGLIDTHVHIESSMLTPANFAAAVLPHGTTTVIVDPHEIANVLGLEGVRYMLDASDGLPLKVFLLAPSCVPAVPGLETAGAEFGSAEINEMLSWPRVIGLAEVMDYPGVIAGSERMISILATAKKTGGLICGHCPYVRGPDLQTYMAAGPDSDHEVLDQEEMLEKIRSGMTIEAHESFHSENVSHLVSILDSFPFIPPNVTFCIDDLPADSLMEDGHLDRVLRRAVSYGMDPNVAVRIATQHAAARCRLFDSGVVRAGNRADLVLFEDLEDFNVHLVIADGRVVAQEGALITNIPTQSFPIESLPTVILPEIPRTETFRVSASGKSKRVRVVSFDKESILGCFEELNIPVVGGALQWRSNPDLCMVGIFERHGQGGHHSLGFIKGFGLKRGAIASTVAHDSHNLLVVGRDPKDMSMAVESVVKLGGGMACFASGQKIGGVALPIAGLLSNRPPRDVADELKEFKKAVISLGIGGRNPMMSITGLALPVIPEARFSDLGLVDVVNQRLVPLFIE